MINAITHMRMFDAVVNHAYKVQKPSDDLIIPQQEDLQKFENARQYALALNSVGLLQAFYERLVKEQV